jgi:hypothetical protein
LLGLALQFPQSKGGAVLNIPWFSLVANVQYTFTVSVGAGAGAASASSLFLTTLQFKRMLLLPVCRRHCVGAVVRGACRGLPQPAVSGSCALS